MTKSSRRIARWFACAMLLLVPPPALAQQEIQFWHSMSGALGDKIVDFSNRFNASQNAYRVMPVFKGTYQESMTSAIAAFRAGKAPEIVQVYDIATAMMMSAKGAVKPLHVLMKEAGEPFDAAAYLPPIASYYADREGRLMSLPFNVSTNVLYVNQAAFTKAGIDARRPPQTWREFIQVAEKLKKSGQQCVYTTNCPSCVHVENMAVWHNVPIATRENGLAGWDTVLQIAGPLYIRHMTMLADLARRGMFTYAGRLAEGDARFYSGECAMLTASSSAIGNIRRNAKFAYSINTLPYHDDVPGAPQNMLVSGASLWVLNGKSPAAYQGVARFFTFLSAPAIQLEWHEATGYMPVTMAAHDLAVKSGYYKSHPGMDIPVRSLLHKPPTVNSKGVRFGNFIQVRSAIDEELEQMFAGTKSPQAALGNAVKRGNEILRKFESTVK